MKYLSIILLLTINVFAQNCVSMNEVQKDNLEYTLKDMIINNGIICDNGYFWNGSHSYKRMSICIAEYFNENKRLSIFKDTNDNLYYAVRYYDEYGMTIKELPFTKTNKTCIDLYNQFKTDMSK